MTPTTTPGLQQERDGVIRSSDLFDGYQRHDRWREKERDEWLTPPEIIKALGKFDLDPSAPRVRPWPMAREHYTVEDSGLLKPWRGRVWLNPPYGLVIGKWMARMAEHKNGVALIFARTESEYWHEHVWPNADALLFLRGRLKFYNVNGTQPENTGPAPSVLVAYGRANVEALKTCGLAGALAYPSNQ